MDELTQSYGHLRLAAAHAAGGTAEKMAPTYDKARAAASRGWSTTRGAAVPPPSGQGVARMRKARKKASGKTRWPAFVGLVAAGAAVGAVGAVVARRRRNAAQWDEYEPMPALGDTGLPGESRPGEPAGEQRSSASDKVSAGAASVAKTVSNRAGKVAESMRGRPSSSSGGTGGPASSVTSPGTGGPPASGPEAGTPDEVARRMNEDRGRGGTFSAFADETRDDIGRS